MKNVSIKESIRLHLRAFSMIHDLCPGLFLAITFSQALAALSPYLTIYLGSQIITELAGANRPEILWKLAGFTLGTKAFLHLVAVWLQQKESVKKSVFYQKLEQLYTRKLFSMDYSSLDDFKTHDLLAQIHQNDNYLGLGLTTTVQIIFCRGIKGLFGLLGAAALTVSLFTQKVPLSAGLWTALNEPGLSVAVIIVLLLTTVLGPICLAKSESYNAKTAEAATMGNRLYDTFLLNRIDSEQAMDMRIYRQRTVIRNYFDRYNPFTSDGDIARINRGPMGLWAVLGSILSILVMGLVYIFVGLKAWAGAFGIGSVTQYVGSVTTLMGSLSLLLEAIGKLKNNAPFLQTTYKFLDIPNKMYQGSLTTEKRSDRQYQVEFRDVSFKYPGCDSWALRHVNMKFRIGRRLAIVGENGSGKTTFIKLLCRLYDPQEGQILLNGIDIRKYRYDDYMEIFSVVFQDFKLLSQPLGANVAGSSTYDCIRAEKALVDAGFGDRLKTMPQGLDTMLYKDFAEDGVEVSGGEAQKIAIARALYKNAPFIILDEPTAALDPIAEAEIYEKFNEISGDRTAIYISHRLSSCKFCDEIAVFDHGKVIQQGTHEALLSEQNGKYAALWNAQAQYYVENQIRE